MGFTLRIDGGYVVWPGSKPQRASIGMNGSKIVAIGDLAGLASDQVVDVDGAYVLPGIIDPHVHIGFTDEEKEFETESRAAALGGVTTMLVYFRKLGSYEETLRDFILRGARTSHVDFAVHLGTLHDDHLGKLANLAQRFGLASVKMYTTYKHGELEDQGLMGQDDGFIFDAMRTIKSIGGLRVNVHCENDDLVLRKEHQVTLEGSAVRQWSQARPILAEVEAVRRIGLLARETGCPTYLVHISSARGLNAALQERALGAPLTIETCSHYLAADLLESSGILAKVNPPIRTGEDAGELWEALRLGAIDAVGTDHAALLRSQKEVRDVREARPGFPGLGTLLPVLLDGVSRGLLNLGDIARLQAQAADTFTLPNKGRIRIGADADLCIVDTAVKQSLARVGFAGISDFSPFEDIELTGWPVMTVKGGEVIAREGDFCAHQSSGNYVRDVSIAD